MVVTIALNTFRSMRNSIIKKSIHISNINNKHQSGFKYPRIFVIVSILVASITLYTFKNRGGYTNKHSTTNIAACIGNSVDIISKSYNDPPYHETQKLWLKNIPSCIATNKEPNCLTDNAIWENVPFRDNVQNIYKCLNAHLMNNNEEPIVTQSTQLALYSGIAAQKYIKTQSKFFYDERTKSASDFFQLGNGYLSTGNEAFKYHKYQILSDLICLWIVDQVHYTENKSLVVYQSILPYDIELKDAKSDIIAQRQLLVKYGVTEGISVGGYFWRTEQLRAHQNKDELVIPMYLMKYNIDSSDDIKGEFSIAFTHLFGFENNIPIVFKCLKSRTIHPIKRVGSKYFNPGDDVPTISDLITAFNNKDEGSSFSIEKLATLSFDELYEFIQFTVNIQYVEPDISGILDDLTECS